MVGLMMQRATRTASTPGARLAGPWPRAEKGCLRLPGPFEFKRGGALSEVVLAYETWGTLAATADNAILVLTGLSPSAHARSSVRDATVGWWEDMIGPGRPLDTDRFYVICVNSLGSCFGSTGPTSIDPHAGTPYRLRFPQLTIEDIAAATHQAVVALGVERLHGVIGPSMGGMTALAYAIACPQGVGRLALISSAGRVEARAIAVHSLQREAIRADPMWDAGDYDAARPPVAGMKLARKIGMTSYRSAPEWESRFKNTRTDLRSTEPFGTEFQVESYLEAAARKFVDGFDANAYLYLSRAMDLFDTGEHAGGLPGALAPLTLEKVLVVGVETDTLFPVHQQAALAADFETAGHATEFIKLASPQGHDAFLVDMKRFGPILRSFLHI
jgi:homoserine O-acetyltransferase